jgi:hypothetical protein
MGGVSSALPGEVESLRRKKSRQVNNLEHVLVDEVVQLRRDML